MGEGAISIDEMKAERLVGQYADMILRIAYTWLNHAEDAKDICQTVLMKCWEQTRVFADVEQERAWVIRVTINTCKNWKKSAWFRHTVPLDDTLSLCVQMPELDDTVLPMVQTLPLKYRRVIYLRYYEGYEVREMASLLHETPALVSTHLARARAKLKELLGGDDDGRTIPE